MYLSASWITRLPPLLVMSPNEPLVGLEVAPPQFGWLNTLNTSKRNCRSWCSRVGKSLRMAPSRFQEPGLRSELRGWTPKVPAVGAANAALLNHTAESVKAVGSRWGSPVRFQNWLPLPAPTPA